MTAAAPLEATEKVPVEGSKKKRKQRSAMALSGRDRTVFFLMVAIPTFFHVMLVWVPTMASIFFSTFCLSLTTIFIV